MYLLDEDRVRNILVEEGFDPRQIDLLLKNFPPLHDDLKPAVDVWLDNRLITDVSVDNISIHDVMTQRKCHFIIAIRDMNRLLDPNITPEKREQWRRIITTPVQYR